LKFSFGGSVCYLVNHYRILGWSMKKMISFNLLVFNSMEGELL